MPTYQLNEKLLNDNRLKCRKITIDKFGGTMSRNSIVTSKENSPATKKSNLKNDAIIPKSSLNSKISIRENYLTEIIKKAKEQGQNEAKA